MRSTINHMMCMGMGIALATSSVEAQGPRAPLSGIEDYITAGMNIWHVPGMAVAVVKDDSIVFSRGFGVREIGKPDRVDENTLFAIGSNTKLFTAVATGMLVDAGRMHWDDPVTTYLPSFQLYDPWVTREITIRDILSHRSGLGERGAMIAYGNNLSRAEVLRRVRYLKPNTSFRSQFGYQNLMVLAAGEAAAAAANQTWDALVKERIFAPLGMASTNTSVRDLLGRDNVATPHAGEAWRAVPIPWRNIDNMGPAGAINSSAADMAKWVRFLLDSGEVNGVSLIQPATLREIESPQTIISVTPDPLRPSIHFLDYGLGVMMHDYQGLKVVTHTGGIDGMLSEVTMVPEKHLGIIVLTNADGHNALFDAIAKRILDMYLGAPEHDWSAILLDRMNARERALHAYAAAAEAKRPLGTKASLPLEGYGGTFNNTMYGDVSVGVVDKHLVLKIGSAFTADLEHWANDSFKATWRGAPNDVLGHPLVLFSVGPMGAVSSLQLSDDVLTPPGQRVWENDEFTRVEEPTPAGPYGDCVTCVKAKHLGGAINEMLAFELMPYSVNRWIGQKPEDQTTLRSWSRNIRRGWGWDNDHFPVNQFAHPYSGALFFNSARSHGYNFWQSAPFAMAGSVLWEYFGETTRPSVNDLANTSLGGITLGETAFRVSSVILDGHSTGGGRVIREIGAALIDPPWALTRILRGDVRRVGSNSGDRGPSSVVSHLELGYQRTDRAVDQRPLRGPSRLFANYALAYGDPLAGDVKQPFGALRLDATLATGVTAAISAMRVLGFLAVHDLNESGGSNQQLAAAMHYHYNNNRAFVTGGQGFSGGLISRYRLGGHNSLRTEFWLTGIALGAVKSDFGSDAAAIDSAAARSYDYGPGAGGRLLARVDHGSQTIVDVSYEPFWYDVLSGVAREHFYDVTNARVQVPVFGSAAVGARQVVYRRVARYATHPTAHTADGQTQLFFAVRF